MINGAILIKRPGETRALARSFTEKLAETELLSGTPTVAEVGTSDLTIDNAAVTDEELVIAGLTVSAGKAVSFTVAGGVTRTEYTLRITVDTDADQILVEDIRIAIL